MQMKTVGVKVTPEIYHQLRSLAESEGVSFSQFLRGLFMARLTHGEPNHQKTLVDFQPALTALENQLTEKREQLTQKDEQIDQLHQIVAMAQSNQADTLKQLEDAKTQGQRRWWKLWS